MTGTQMEVTVRFLVEVLRPMSEHEVVDLIRWYHDVSTLDGSTAHSVLDPSAMEIVNVLDYGTFRVSAEETAARIDALSGNDPESAHGEADLALLAMVPEKVALAYDRLIDRCRFWASA